MSKEKDENIEELEKEEEVKKEKRWHSHLKKKKENTR